MKEQKARYNVLGVGVSALTLDQARDLVLGARGARPLGYVCVTPVHAVSEACADPAFRKILNESFLTTARRACRSSGWVPPGVGRVYGPDLMLAVCDAGRGVGLRHDFYTAALPASRNCCDATNSRRVFPVSRLSARLPHPTAR